MEDPDLDILGGQIFRRLAKGLERSLHIGPQDDPQFLDFALAHLLKEIIERDLAGCAQFAFPGLERPDLGNTPGHLLVGDHDKFVAGLGTPDRP